MPSGYDNPVFLRLLYFERGSLNWRSSNEGATRSMSDSDVKAAARRLALAKNVVVLTGAGVSKESGIPTFRDAMTGIWANFDPEKLATPEGFLADPGLVWRW